MHKPTLSNKVFTENPLLDEIVYNARQLATGVILKDEDKANNAETVESIHMGDVLIAINRGNIKFSNFKYDSEFLRGYYVSESEVAKYAMDNDLIPASDRPKLLEMAVKSFTENYVEYNNYYRMLHGLPNYDETGIWEGLWIDVNSINEFTPTSMDHISNMYKEEYGDGADGKRIVVSDYQLIHELPFSIKNLLYDNGTSENIINASEQLANWELTQDDVMYVMHLGDREVDYYDAREAEKFALLYCPSCDAEEVRRRFKDLFEANRLYLLYTMYSDAYKIRSDYYDNFMMAFLVIQTIIDMIIELPEYIIRRDVFDTRTCKYIFEANGVRYFKDIPLKYQITLVKSLNKLIKFKSTDKCIVDIISIFGVENIQVFKYYIMKDHNAILEKPTGQKEYDVFYLDNTKEVVDQEGNIKVMQDNDSNYDLKFIKVPLLEKYDDHIRTESNIYSYDSIIEGDDYWIGDKDYQTVKSDIKDLDFTVLRTKYYSIEAVIDLAKRNFIMVYFMNMLMNHNIDESSLRVNMPNISTTRKFELMDIICTLFSLGYIYYGVEDTIIDTRAKAAQIMGFNMEADLSKISSWLYENHRGLTLKDLHVDTFKVPENGKIMSFNELEDMFFTNKDCYDHIHEVMRNPPSKEIYDAYRYIYKALLTTDRNMEYFLVGDNPVVDQYKNELGFKTKFINIPKQIEYYCPHCHALVDPTKAATGPMTCPVCKKVIGDIATERYTNPDDYNRDYKWMLDSMDETTLYFVIRNDFDTSHMYDLYIKENEALKNVGTARMAYTYREFLRYKDVVLYSFLNEIVNIRSFSTRQEACINSIQSIVTFLKDYIDQDGDDAIPLDTVFSGLPSISLDFIKKYVTEVVDFFKSFKIFTHESSIIYVIDDKFDNYVQLIDHILLKYLFDKADIVKIEDYLEGKATLDHGFLLNKGPGIGVSISTEERHELIDKVWFSIYTWLNNNYSEFYNSDNYKEAERAIRDYIDVFSNYLKTDKVMGGKYIEDIQDNAVDAILRMLVDIVKDDRIEINESISMKSGKQIDEFYNEWIADLMMLTIKREVSDKFRYQDDYIKNDFYDIHSKYDIKDGRQLTHADMMFSNKYSIFDAINMIATQEFPEHSFDE